MDRSRYLELKNISKTFGAVTALDTVSFHVRQGEFLSILGPSGCGKTTALRVIAGLELQDSGQVFINGKDVSRLSVALRNVGIVFQSYALFPNITAAGNVAYGLTGHASRSKVQERVVELMELVGLSGLGDKYPAQLSGGQQQRVALARAMALSPNLLLLDEPLSALDARVRVRLRNEIRRLQQRLGVTTIMVTHDQEEALTMADRILVMDRARVVQEGTPHDIYEKPATPFVAAFIGSMNFMSSAVKVEKGVYAIGGVTVQVARENGTARLVQGGRATLAIRPEDVMVEEPSTAGVNRFTGYIDEMEYRGSLFRLGLSLSSSEGSKGEPLPRIAADVPTEKIRRCGINANSQVSVALPPDRMLVYMDHDGAALPFHQGGTASKGSRGVIRG